MFRRFSAACGLVLCLGIAGCPLSPPATSLTGEWLLTTEEDVGLSEVYLEFNAQNDLDGFRYRFNGVTRFAQITSAETRINSTIVNLTADFVGANALVFSGTINGAGTRIDGSVTLQLIEGTQTIRLDDGRATLRKQ